MKKVILLLIVFICTMLYSQDIYDWQVITSMNNIQQMKSMDDALWMATTSGAYVYNIDDSTTRSFNNLDGLQSLNLTSVDADNRDNIIFGSKNGIISVYNKNNDNWFNDNTLSGQNINDIHVIADTLWISTDNGVGVFLYYNGLYEFRDFYSNFPVLPASGSEIIWYNNKIYYGTDSGLLSAPANFLKYNLKSTDNWSLILDDDLMPDKNIQTLNIINDTLFIGLSLSAVMLDKDENISNALGWIYGNVQNIVAIKDTIFFMRGTSISYYTEGRWGFFKQAPNLINHATNAGGRFWIATENGLLRSDWKQAFRMVGPYFSNIGIVIKDSKDNLWATSGKFKLTYKKGLYKYDFEKWSAYNFNGNFWQYKSASDYVYETIDGQIWVATWNGGLYFIEDTMMTFIHPHDEEGEMLISTADAERIVAIDPIPVDYQNCLSSSSESNALQVITGFTEDEKGNLWLSNFIAQNSEYITMIPRNDNGKLNMDCSTWLHFGNASGLQFSTEEGQISCLEFDDFGRLWFGTFQAGLLVYDFNNTLENFSDDELFRIGIEDDLYSERVLSIAKDKDGIMWIGTDAGFNSYDGVNFYKHVGDLGPVENKINHIFVDDYNNKWFSTEGGLTVLRAEKSPWETSAWVNYTTNNSGLPADVINSVFVDSDAGEAYIGTEYGLAIFRGTFVEYKDDLKLATGGPNPFVLRSENEYFTIKNLMPNSTVKILNINGKLIRTLNIQNEGVLGSRAFWNGKNDNGRYASSGIYIYLVYTEEGVVGKGKISVINP